MNSPASLVPPSAGYNPRLLPLRLESDCPLCWVESLAAAASSGSFPTGCCLPLPVRCCPPRLGPFSAGGRSRLARCCYQHRWFLCFSTTHTAGCPTSTPLWETSRVHRPCSLRSLERGEKKNNILVPLLKYPNPLWDTDTLECAGTDYFKDNKLYFVLFSN